MSSELRGVMFFVGPSDLSHSGALLSAAAERVWEVFIQNKKEVCILDSSISSKLFFLEVQ